MRITGGRLRGRVVPSPEGEGIRPTASRVREACFSMLGNDLHGLSVLDAFGGSGLLAFEAASRGARAVTLFERDRRAAAALQRVAGDLGVEIELVVGDTARLIAGRSFDLILADPPYGDDPVRWLRCLGPAATWRLCIETRAGAALPPAIAGMRRQKAKTYGSSALAIYGPGAASGLAPDQVVSEDSGVVEGDGESVQQG